MTIERHLHESGVDHLAIFKPEVVILPYPEGVDRYAGEIVIKQIYNKPNSSLTLATGSSPLGVYDLMIKAYQNGLDMSKLTTRNLDEYWPLSKSDPLSYDRFMRENLFNHVNIPEAHRHIPNGEVLDPVKEVERYEQILTATGPADLVILGIGPGSTCHMAFNERGSELNSRTRLVYIDEETVEANARFCSGDKNKVPRQAITQGIANILEGNRILLIAKGSNKAEGIKRTLEGSIGPDAPASFLRYHANVTIVIDKDAGRLLS